MAKVHFLNVGDGDCSVIQHDSGRNTMIDINKGGTQVSSLMGLSDSLLTKGVQGNFNQKANPTDPLKFISQKGISSLFRFILTHPDMDHMGGLSKLMTSLDVNNFWDSKNNKVIDPETWEKTGYSKKDWEMYQNIRTGKFPDITYLCLEAGATGTFYNEGKTLLDNGDGIFILAPTKELVAEANKKENYNDCSYVLLFKNEGHKMILAGDSDDATWNYILEEHEELIKDIDILIAPHHGRKSGRKWDFLDVMKPKLTLIGNAPSEHIAYDKYRKYGATITNNQAGDVTLIFKDQDVDIYVTNPKYAEKFKYSHYNKTEDAYYIGAIVNGHLLLSTKERQEIEHSWRL